MAHPMTDRPAPVGARRAARPWPRWLRVVVLIGAVILVGAVVLAALRLLDRREFDSVTLGGPVDRIDVQLSSGEVRLVAAEGEDVAVQRSRAWRFRSPEIEATVDNGTVRVRATCPRVAIPLGHCSADHRIEVPSGVRVDVRTDAGSVQVEGLDGWVRVVTTDGEVTASGLRSPEMIVDSSGGRVEVGFAVSPSRVGLDSGGGDIHLFLPPDRYEITTVAGGGDVAERVGSEAFAERMVDLRSNGGDIIVEPPPRVSRDTED